MKAIQTAIFFILLTVGQTVLHAQNDPVRSHWLDMSVGFGGLENLTYTLNGEYRFQSGHDLFTLSVLHTKEIPNIFFFGPSQPPEQITSFGVLYGRTYGFHLERPLFPFFPFAILIHSPSDYSISLSAGVGIISSVRRGIKLFDATNEGVDEYTSIKQLIGGVPVQFEFVQYFGPNFGYTHRVYGNLNRAQNTFGMLWGIQTRILQPRD